MKIFKIVLIVVAILIALMVIVTFFLPSKFKIERITEIKAPASTVFEQINVLKHWPEWDPWMAYDTAQVRTYNDIKGGAGSSFEWKSNNEKVGNGSLKILESVPAKMLKFTISNDGMQMGYGQFDLTESNGNTKVVWSMQGELSFFERWFGLMIESMVGPDFEKGLARLKNIAEKNPYGNIIITVEETKAVPILYISDSTSTEPDKIAATIGKAYQEIGEFMGKNKIEMAGPPIAITRFFDFKRYSFDAAMPIVQQNVKTDGRIKLGTTYAGKAVKGIYVGSYDQASSAYYAIEKFIKDHDLLINGNSWEVYMNDPANTKQEDLVTHIYYPVKDKTN